MSCIPSAAYRIILARCTVRNGSVTVFARRSSSARSSPESSITCWLALGTTHNSAHPPLSLPIVRRTWECTSTRPCGTSASRDSVTRPVPQPTSRMVAACAIPASRARTSAAHVCCGALDTSYVCASQGVLIAGWSGLGSGRRSGQDSGEVSSSTRLSVAQKRTKLRLSANLRIGSARRIAPVGCPYTLN